jgi:hypothetical protein
LRRCVLLACNLQEHVASVVVGKGLPGGEWARRHGRARVFGFGFRPPFEGTQGAVMIQIRRVVAKVVGARVGAGAHVEGEALAGAGGAKSADGGHADGRRGGGWRGGSADGRRPVGNRGRAMLGGPPLLLGVGLRQLGQNKLPLARGRVQRGGVWGAEGDAEDEIGGGGPFSSLC